MKYRATLEYEIAYLNYNFLNLLRFLNLLSDQIIFIDNRGPDLKYNFQHYSNEGFSTLHDRFYGLLRETDVNISRI